MSDCILLPTKHEAIKNDDQTNAINCVPVISLHLANTETLIHTRPVERIAPHLTNDTRPSGYIQESGKLYII